MSDRSYRFVVENSQSGNRLDRVLPDLVAAVGQEVSRSLLQNWIRDGHVLVAGKTVKPRHPLSAGEEIILTIPEVKERELKSEAIPLEILYEDDDLLVIHKRAGMVVHPGSGNEGGTLVNALLHHTEGNLSRLADPDRPGIVHRLDKDTSGCLVVAKSDQAYTSLVDQFSGRETSKEYLAVTEGIPSQEEGRIETQIGRHPGNRQKMAVVEAPGGKEAITEYKVLTKSCDENWALLSCHIHTGRTHQIRVHLKDVLHCPILGDPIYAQPKRQKSSTGRLMLHAWKLSFTHPNGERLSFEAEVPQEFSRFR